MGNILPLSTARHDLRLACGIYPGIAPALIPSRAMGRWRVWCAVALAWIGALMGGVSLVLWWMDVLRGVLVVGGH